MAPRIPGIGDVAAILRQQTEALAALPATVVALQRSVLALADTVNAGRETVAIVHRLAVRLERLVDELEEPLTALAPGLTRTAKLLDDPVMDTIPDTIRRLQAEAMPLLRAVSETQNRLMQLPGASLFGAVTGQRPRKAPDPPAS